MKIEIDDIYGIYDLVSIESYHEGQRSDEKAKSGTFVFTRDQRLAVVSGSNRSVLGYTGRFVIAAGQKLQIEVEACSARELEGRTIERKILKLDPELLVLEATSADAKVRIELTWKKKLKL